MAGDEAVVVISGTLRGWMALCELIKSGDIRAIESGVMHTGHHSHDDSPPTQNPGPAVRPST